MKNPIDEYIDIYRQEAYVYFDKNIRSLPKKESGEFDESGGAMHNNDVDAFRHSYVSGVMAQQWSVGIAELMGVAVEWLGRNPENQKNMDLWNNSIGRKYGKQAKSREELAELLKQALENGEFIISLDDARKYEGKTSYKIDSNKPIIVLKENKTGRNELFYDFLSGNIMDREVFANSIESCQYPGYTVASIDGKSTPMSKPDGIAANNLG